MYSTQPARPRDGGKACSNSSPLNVLEPSSQALKFIWPVLLAKHTGTRTYDKALTFGTKVKVQGGQPSVRHKVALKIRFATQTQRAPEFLLTVNLM